MRSTGEALLRTLPGRAAILPISLKALSAKDDPYGISTLEMQGNLQSGGKTVSVQVKRKGDSTLSKSQKGEKKGQWLFTFCLLLVSLALGDRVSQLPLRFLPLGNLCVGMLSQYTPHSFYLVSANQPPFLPHHLPPCPQRC